MSACSVLRPRALGLFLSRALGLLTILCTLPFAACSSRQDAMAAQNSATVNVLGGTIDVTLPDEALSVTRDQLLTWVVRAATAVSQYYGRFPASHLTLRVRAGNGSGVGHGVTYPRGGGLIFISVGRNATVADLNDDWVLTHEMIHLAFPNMADEHHWIEEGISTYVEPVARVAAGQMSAAEMWRVFMRDMPKGLPEPGDKGLDHTPTWGRTYWGGAMFCLFADVTIREQTHNRYGLRDALRAILNHGGKITEDWDIEKTLSIGDQGTGTKVLENLYAQMRDKPSPLDLDSLWQKLGLSLKNGSVVFNDQAPDAAIRKAITAPAH